MVEASYADKLLAVIARVRDFSQQAESSLTPYRMFQTKIEAIEKRVDELLDSDPKKYKEDLRQCFYDRKGIEEDYKATATAQETAFQQGKKQMTITLFGELFTILGPSMLREILASYKQPCCHQSYLPGSPSPNQSDASQNNRKSPQRSADSPTRTTPAEDVQDVEMTTGSQERTASNYPEPTLAQNSQADAGVPSPAIRAPDGINASRSISFDDVYQNGQADVKHLIIEYPKQSAHWYIVTCERHKKQFYGENPLTGACRHLTSKAHSESGAYEDVIRLLGVAVEDCNPEMAAKNNQVVKESMAQYYQHLSSAQAKRFKGKKRRRTDDINASDLSDYVHESGFPSHRNSRRKEGIIDPIVGDVYSVYWEGDRQWYAGVVLSTKDPIQPDLPNLYQTALLDSEKPGCYIYDPQCKIIAWASGYEDGGPHVQDRQFPVLFFDRDRFPDSCQTAWVSCRNFKPFDAVTKDLPFRRLVEQYLIKHRNDAIDAGTRSHFGDQFAQNQMGQLPTPTAEGETTQEAPENAQPDAEYNTTAPSNPSVTTPRPSTYETIAGLRPSTSGGEDSSTDIRNIPSKAEQLPQMPIRDVAEPFQQPVTSATPLSNTDSYAIPAVPAAPQIQPNVVPDATMQSQAQPSATQATQPPPMPSPAPVHPPYRVTANSTLSKHLEFIGSLNNHSAGMTNLNLEAQQRPPITPQPLPPMFRSPPSSQTTSTQAEQRSPELGNFSELYEHPVSTPLTRYARTPEYTISGFKPCNGR